MIDLAQVAPISTDTLTAVAAPPEWVETVKTVWTILSLIVIPWLWKNSAKFRAIATVIVQGVEVAGDDRTKAAVKDAAEKAGIQPKLAPFVSKVTEHPPQREADLGP